MVQITAGRYGKPETWKDRSVIDPSSGRYKTACRWCGEPRQGRFHYYCSREHKELWEAKYSPPVWGFVRLEILERDNHTCQICGVTQDELTQTSQETNRYFFSEFSLEIDHIKPVKTHPHLEFDRDNLRTLCHDCHAKHGANPRSRPKAPPPSQPRLHEYEEAP